MADGWFREVRNVQNIMYFKHILQTLNWQDVFNTSSVDNKYENFHYEIATAFNLAFPLIKTKKRNRNKTDKGWITSGIRVSSEKLKLLFKLSQSGDTILRDYYKTYKSIYRTVVRRAKRAYFGNLITNSTNKGKTVWRIINGG